MDFTSCKGKAGHIGLLSKELNLSAKHLVFFQVHIPAILQGEQHWALLLSFKGKEGSSSLFFFF